MTELLNENFQRQKIFKQSIFFPKNAIDKTSDQKYGLFTKVNSQKPKKDMGIKTLTVTVVNDDSSINY